MAAVLSPYSLRSFATSARHRAEYLAFQTVVCIADSLPMAWADRLAVGLALFVHHVLPQKVSRYHVARENLVNAFGDDLTEPERRQIVLGMWKHLFRMVLEIIQSPRKLHLRTYRRLIQFAEFRPTVEAFSSGRRVLLLGGHFGNWEVAISVFGLWGFPMGVVARELDNPYLNDWFQRYRQATGHRMLLKKGGYDEMLELLKRGGNLGLLCDQDAGSRGLFVDFFGKPASTFKSIALLAMEYDALVVLGYSFRLPERHNGFSQFELGCELVLDPRKIESKDPVRTITEEYTKALERAVRRAPGQYFWVHRRWKSEPKAPRKPAPSTPMAATPATATLSGNPA